MFYVLIKKERKLDSIKFVNGSEINIIKGNGYYTEKPMMLFAIDIAKQDAEDMSCISYYCTKCKTIFHVDHFNNDTHVNPKLFSDCPRCHARFVGWIQNF